MASTGGGGAARRRERSTSGVQDPSGKRRKAGNGSIDDAITEEGDSAKTNLDIIIENWATVHACLGQKDVVHSSRTCRHLHELCVDEDGRVHVNEIDWLVRRINFVSYYRMLQNVRFDKIKTIHLKLLRSLTVDQLVMIYTTLSSPRDYFTLLERLDISHSPSFPNGPEVLLADFGSKLANHSPDLRELLIRTKAFSSGSFAIMNPVLQKNMLTKLLLIHDNSYLRANLIGNHEAEELAELITSSTNLVCLKIALFGSDAEDETSELLSSWFKTKLLSVIRAKSLGGENTLASQSRLKYLSLHLSFTDDSGCLNTEELVHLLHHFSGPNLSQLVLSGNWRSDWRSTAITSSLDTELVSADAICRALSLSPSLTKITFRDMSDNEGFLWGVLSRFVSEKESSCEVTCRPCNMDDGFFEGLKKGAAYIVPFIKRRGGGSKWDAKLSHHGSRGWTLRVNEVMSTDGSTV